MGEPVPAVTVSEGDGWRRWGAEASPQQGRDSSTPLLCPAGFLQQGQLPKHTEKLCHNKEINYKTVDLGCVCLGQSQGRSRGHKRSKSRSRKGGEEKSLHQ